MKSKLPVLALILLLSVPALGATTEDECLSKDFSNRMSSGQFQPPRLAVCWAFASARLYEEQMCLEHGGAACGLMLSPADAMRCSFSLQPTAPERALHCVLDSGICSEENAPFPRESYPQYSDFSKLWQSAQCSQNRLTSQLNSTLVVRGRFTTSNTGLRASDDYIEDADLHAAVRQALAAGRSCAVMYMASSAERDDIRHALVVKGMRWNHSEKTCEVLVENPDDELEPDSGWSSFDELMLLAYRVTWIRN